MKDGHIRPKANTGVVRSMVAAGSLSGKIHSSANKKVRSSRPLMPWSLLLKKWRGTDDIGLGG